MRLHIDDAACVASGVCASLAPRRFELTSQVAVLDSEVTTDAEDAALVDDAVACCPVAAITLIENEGP